MDIIELSVYQKDDRAYLSCRRNGRLIRLNTDRLIIGIENETIAFTVPTVMQLLSADEFAKSEATADPKASAKSSKKKVDF